MRVGFNIGKPNREKLVALLEGLIALNRIQIRRSPRPIPGLYGTGVVYQRERRDPRTGLRREEWRTIAEVLGHGVGDCEDLASYIIAMRREQGINAQPWVTRHKNTWHVRVRYPDGKIEDPSEKLGMRVPAGGLR